MSWPILWFLPRALLSTRGPRVSADARPSLHPRLARGDADDQPGHDGVAGMMRCVLMQMLTPPTTPSPSSRTSARSRARRSGIHNPMETCEAQWPLHPAQPDPPRRMDRESAATNAGALAALPGMTPLMWGAAWAAVLNTSPILTLIRRCEALLFPVKALSRAPRQHSINGFAAPFSCLRKGFGNADSQRRDRGHRRGRRPVDRARPAAGSRPDRRARASAS